MSERTADGMDLPWRWVVGYCAVAFGAYAAGAYYLNLAAGTPHGTAVVRSLARGLSMFFMWTATVGVSLWISRRVPSTAPRHLAPAVLAALVAISVVATLQDVANCLLLRWLPCSLNPMWFGGRLGQLPVIAMVAVNGLIFGVGARASRRAHADRQRAQRLEAELARARMAVLDLQLRPHFLFNTLQSIATLAHVDVAAAGDMLSRLSQLLRESSAGEGEAVVPLRRELRLVALYTDIESVRFGARLTVRVDADDDALDVPVPHMLLQPLVENAIRHAIARVGRGRVDVTARRDAATGRLRLEVRDDGPGLPEGWTAPGDRVGLANTRERLETMYGPRADFALSNGEGGGLRVRMEIPADEPWTEK